MKKYYISTYMQEDNKLVWFKHRSCSGYTTILDHAGVYSEADANYYCENNKGYTKHRVEDIDALAHRSVYRHREAW